MVISIEKLTNADFGGHTASQRQKWEGKHVSGPSTASFFTHLRKGKPGYQIWALKHQPTGFAK